MVVGLDSTTGLQTARILARRGVPVIGVAADAGHPCCRTRVCQEIVIGDTSGPGLVSTLMDLSRRLPTRGVLFPCTDLAVLTLSRARDAVAPLYHLILPDAEVIETLVDKGRFAEWAERHGLPVPRSRLLRTAADVDDAAASLRFPCMLKPVVRTPEWRRRTKVKGFPVLEPGALRPLFDRCRAWTDALLVQELVPGDDTSHVTCNCYVTKGGWPAVTFTSRKLRQWPITAGEGCLSEEVRNETVRAETIRLFRAAGHRGLGYVEFKRHEATGEYLILEPNVGRPTGRSAQAEAAGVELILTQYCDAVGLPLPAARVQRYGGTKWVHFRRDLQSAFYHWRRGELSAGAWLRSWRGPKTDALFSWRDPLPFLADLEYCARELVTRRRGRPSPPVASQPVAP